MEIDDERDQKMFELYESGWNCVNIAEKFGITRERVGQILRKFGYTPRPSAKVIEQNFRRLHAEGLTNLQLAAALSVSPTTIYKNLMKYALERNPKPAKIKESCSVENCPDSGTRRGYCQKHYMRFLKYGSPLSVGKAGRPKRKDATK